MISAAAWDRVGLISAELGPMALPPAADALAWTLLHFLWQGALLAGGLALVNLALRGADSRARYLAGCATLFLMALLPVLTFALLCAELNRAVPADPAAVLSQMAAANRGTAAVTMRWLLGAWSLGAVMMSIRLAGGWSYLRLFLRRQTHPVDPIWQTLVQRLARQMGIGQKVQVRGTEEELGPMLIGWIRPVILLPMSMLSTLPEEYLESLILHEIAHIRRHDQLVNLLQSIVEALLFYHPCVWWVSRRIRVEREFCCDDMVLDQNPDRVGYARALAALAAVSPRTLSPASPASGGSLMFRIKRIVNPRIPFHSELISNLSVLLLAALVALGIFGVAIAHDAGDEGTGIAWMPRSIQKLAPLFAKAAERHGVDAELLAIMTLVESGGQPRARSTAGARGLLQIMPATAEKIAAERGLADYGIAQLEDPEINIDFGAWYLAQQLSTFTSADPEQTMALAVAAYNSGPNHVRTHLEAGAPLRNETARYRDLVLELWRDRHADTSQAFDRFIKRYGPTKPDA